MLLKKFIAGVFIALSLLARTEAISAKVEVLATAAEVREYFVASAVVSPSKLEARLSAADKCVTFGRFRGYSLHLLPFPATAENLPSAHWKHGTGKVVDRTQDRSVRFSMAKDEVPRAYITAHFDADRALQNVHLIEVCIPYSVFEQLVEKWPGR